VSDDPPFPRPLPNAFAGQIVDTARRALMARFKSAGIESAELDARMLLGHVLNLDLTGLITAANRPIAADESARLDEFVRRRLAGEPIARIVGAKEFWGLPLQLSATTLVPRPDTETVVELALETQVAVSGLKRPLRIADIGTGSGAILLALLSEWPDAEGIGTDISEAALSTARINAARLGLTDRAAFIACDYAAGLTGSFDLIVSNPPYIRSADISGLASEVRDYDPHRALDGGPDGLAAYRALIPQAVRHLAPNGVLVLEVGHGQSGEVEQFVAAAGLTREGSPKADLAGIRRAVAGRKLPI
jgi:release factor glutamine methyltransferase